MTDLDREAILMFAVALVVFVALVWAVLAWA